MPTYIALTIDDLDNELKKQNLLLSNMSDYTARRTRSFSRALADYEEKLAEADDAFVRADTVDAPIVLGTAKIAATGGYEYEITPPADYRRVAGNTITVELAATGFLDVPRITLDTIVLGTTAYGFWEKNGKIVIFCKDSTTFTSTWAAVFAYYRRLDATVTAGTALDIHQADFSDIVTNTLTYLTE